MDTCSWIEFFAGTQKGKEIEKILNEKACYTSLISLAEISNLFLKTKQDLSIALERIKHLSVILNLDQEICILAGIINFHRKKLIKNWGMIDSLILATAIVNNLKILTNDEHFKDLSNVEMI